MISPQRALSDVSPSSALLWTEFRTQFDVAGVRKTENMARHPLAPRLLTLGDGSTAATIPQQITGRHGLVFAGTQYVDTGIVDAIEYNNAFSFFSLLNLRNPSTAEKDVISAHDAGQTKGWKLDFGHATNIIRFVFQSGANLLLVSVPLVKNEVISLAATYDGSSLAAGVELYIDGIRQTKTVVSDTLGANTINTGKSAILGGSWSGASIVFPMSADSTMRNAVLTRQVYTPQQVQYLHRQVMTRINAA